MSEKNKEEIKTTSQPMSAVRMDEMGVDDVAIDATMFRFERMDEQTFWLCAYRGDKRTTFTMWTQGGKLYCRRDDDELGTTDDSENPVIPEPFPAPSQPAGAREWRNKERPSSLKYNDTDGRGWWDDERVDTYTAQQTAAKDAELDKLRTWVNCGGVPTGKQCSSPIEFGHEIYGPFIGDGEGNFVCEFHAWKAAEHERDSLREKNTEAKLLLVRAANDLEAFRDAHLTIRSLVASAIRKPENITAELLGQIDAQSSAALKAGDSRRLSS